MGISKSDWSDCCICTCGISNALDDTEDEAIYSEETTELAVEEEMDDEFDTGIEDKHQAIFTMC